MTATLTAAHGVCGTFYKTAGRNVLVQHQGPSSISGKFTVCKGGKGGDSFSVGAGYQLVECEQPAPWPDWAIPAAGDSGEPELEPDAAPEPVRVETEHGSAFWQAASKSYSADRIDGGKIREPFLYGADLWVQTGTELGPDGGKATAQLLVPADKWTSGTISYADAHAEVTAGVRERWDFYTGIAVAWKRKQYVIGADRMEIRWPAPGKASPTPAVDGFEFGPFKVAGYSRDQFNRMTEATKRQIVEDEIPASASSVGPSGTLTVLHDRLPDGHPLHETPDEPAVDAMAVFGDATNTADRIEVVKAITDLDVLRSLRGATVQSRVAQEIARCLTAADVAAKRASDLASAPPASEEAARCAKDVIKASTSASAKPIAVAILADSVELARSTLELTAYRESAKDLAVGVAGAERVWTSRRYPISTDDAPGEVSETADVLLDARGAYLTGYPELLHAVVGGSTRQVKEGLRGFPLRCRALGMTTAGEIAQAYQDAIDMELTAPKPRKRVVEDIRRAADKYIRSVQLDGVRMVEDRDNGLADILHTDLWDDVEAQADASLPTSPTDALAELEPKIPPAFHAALRQVRRAAQRGAAVMSEFVRSLPPAYRGFANEAMAAYAEVEGLEFEVQPVADTDTDTDTDTDAASVLDDTDERADTDTDTGVALPELHQLPPEQQVAQVSTARAIELCKGCGWSPANVAVAIANEAKRPDGPRDVVIEALTDIRQGLEPNVPDGVVKECIDKVVKKAADPDDGPLPGQVRLPPPVADGGTHGDEDRTTIDFAISLLPEEVRDEARMAYRMGGRARLIEFLDVTAYREVAEAHLDRLNGVPLQRVVIAARPGGHSDIFVRPEDGGEPQHVGTTEHPTLHALVVRIMGGQLKQLREENAKLKEEARLLVERVPQTPTNTMQALASDLATFRASGLRVDLRITSDDLDREHK